MAPRAQQANLVFARAHPPRPLEAKVVEAALVRLASDPTGAPVVFETRSAVDKHTGATQVSHWIGTTPEHLRWVRRSLSDLIPGLILDATSAERLPIRTAARVKVRPRGLALLIDRPEQISRSILSALNQQLAAGEQLVLQLVFGPRRSPRHHRGTLPDPTQPWWHLATQGIQNASTPVRKQHDMRALQAGMATCIRLGVTADTSDRQHRLLVGLLGGISTAKAPSTFVSLRRDAAARLNAASTPIIWEFAPAAAELVGPLAWPLGDIDVPGLPPLHPKLLPLAPKLRKPSEAGRSIGVSTVPGLPTTVGLSAIDNLYHAITTGPTGAGKSTSMLQLIRADIHAGRALIVIDPKRQLVDDVLATAVPEHRIDDVVVLDPSEQRVPGFNPLDVGSRDPDVVVDSLLAVFAAVFAEGWGPRTQDITHAGLLTLARVGARGAEPFTLLDLPRLFTDTAFRRSVIGNVANDVGLASFWAWYESQSTHAQAAALAAPSNKWRQYLLRPSVRRILGQPQPKFRLRDVFRDNRIVLVPLNEALIGPVTAQLIGGLIVAEGWTATLERAAEHQPQKRPASVWIDEVQNYLHLPTSLDDALNASRSMGVSWNLAHQFRAQMTPSMLAAIDSNARTKIVFRPSDPKDAAAYARMAPELEAVDFLSLGKYEAYATLVRHGEQQPWCSIKALPPPTPTGLADRIRASSRAHYGGILEGRPTIEGDGLPPIQGADATPIVGRKRRGPQQ